MGENIAVILARGGSQGISGKNITPFCGKPLVAWTIEHSLDAQHIDSVWVSSDDTNILNVAKEFGADVIPRPPHISGDTASSESGWLHALKYIQDTGRSVELVVAPQCTSPVRNSADFDGAIQHFIKQNLDSLFSATLVTDFNIWKPKADGRLSSYTYDHKNRGRRQEKSDQFLENGSFWIFTPDCIRNHNNRLGGEIGIWEMELWKSFQIDEPSDLTFCEVLMNSFLLKEKQLTL